MGNKIKNKRVCKFCGVEFTLSKVQMRQAKNKWAVHCSRACARKNQHNKNYGGIRTIKKCLICKKEFRVSKWDRDKRYCSVKCSSFSRFGEPKKRIAKMNAKVEKILEDDKYFMFLKRISKKLGNTFNVDCDDIIQDYFLGLLEGHNHFIEQSAMSTVRKEYKRGFVKSKFINISGQCCIEDIAYILKEKRNFFDTEDFIDYLIDIGKTLNDIERKIVYLLLQGHNKTETREIITGISNSRYWDFVKRI